ncbi:MAG: glycosyltransferase family 9 protein [Lentisphaeraceae bacterium]|nr:glycosyltransferase family 9 protein [Lentisphaeraceae bacterium]
MKILLIKQTSLGDLIHSSLAIEAIKAKWPESEIHFMVDRSCAFAVENNPHIDQFYYYDKVDHRKRLSKNKLAVFNIASDIFSELKKIRKTNFDLAIDLQGIERSAFFLYFCRAKKKFTKGKKPLMKGFKNASKDDHALTELRGTLKLAEIDAEGYFPKIYVDPKSVTSLQIKLPENLKFAIKDPDTKVIVVSPYTSWKTKDVPVGNWVKAAELISKTYPSAEFVFSATPDKRDELQESLDKALEGKEDLKKRMTNFAGQTNIQELLSLIEQADLVLASEGATGHMASALDTPLCVVFGPTKPSRVGPWGDKSTVVQSKEASCLGCYQRKCDNWICMQGIESQLAEESIKLLK